MNEAVPYSRKERDDLRAASAEGRRLDCPRCGLPLHKRRIDTPPSVGYVRERTWWLCSGCGGSLVLDTSPTGPHS